MKVTSSVRRAISPIIRHRTRATQAATATARPFRQSDSSGPFATTWQDRPASRSSGHGAAIANAHKELMSRNRHSGHENLQSHGATVPTRHSVRSPESTDGDHHEGQTAGRPDRRSAVTRRRRRRPAASCCRTRPRTSRRRARSSPSARASSSRTAAARRSQVKEGDTVLFTTWAGDEFKEQPAATTSSSCARKTSWPSLDE